ncbi:TIGR00730 family Rossman fold protein [Bacteroides sp. 51]|uniref:LOG family protein n=1 Tax=Bacteroides sp. 51 TaxID=2302938 RepID=UPI0013D15F35|nr:TIGR00730 family Rossman fold protein [Bacteroides sp. 51]NDV80491.1 TIGR00730 family Rossman fold protein [Bacteroides sp. 51]
MEYIGIFCSASNTIDQAYFDAASQLGEWMGREHKTLVYGGSNLGLMECIAKAVKDNGGHVIGVIPTKLEKNGRESLIPDEVIHTQNLNDRKDIITAKSDVLIALPGGIGTLDEVFHVMSAATLGYHNKKVVFYNIEGFYNDLLDILDKLIREKFARTKIFSHYEIANTQDELIRLLENI